MRQKYVCGTRELPATAMLTVQSFTKAMASELDTLSNIELDYFTAPTSVSPLSIEGTFDSLISATACLSQLKAQLGRWNGVSPRFLATSRSVCLVTDIQFVVACFSAHPLVNALRELTSAPVHGILEAPLLFASTLGASVGILTTSPRWVPLLTHDIHSLRLSSLNSCGVVSSGLSVLDLEHLPREQVIGRLSEVAKQELDENRGCDVIILGCAGMVGLDKIIEEACTPGITVLDPVSCAIELCAAAVNMGAKTSKAGIYAPASGQGLSGR